MPASTLSFFFALCLSPRGKLGFDSGRHRPQHIEERPHSSRRLQEAPSLEKRAYRKALLTREDDVIDDSLLCSSEATSRLPEMRFSQFFHKHRAGLRRVEGVDQFLFFFRTV